LAFEEAAASLGHAGASANSTQSAELEMQEMNVTNIVLIIILSPVAAFLCLLIAIQLQDELGLSYVFTASEPEDIKSKAPAIGAHGAVAGAAAAGGLLAGVAAFTGQSQPVLRSYSRLGPLEAADVYTLAVYLGPEAQKSTVTVKKQGAGEVVGKATIDEGNKAHEVGFESHGILLDIPPRNHVAFLDTAEIHAKKNPLITVIPWGEPPDPNAEPLAIVKVASSGNGFEVMQRGQVTLVVPVTAAGFLAGVFDHGRESQGIPLRLATFTAGPTSPSAFFHSSGGQVTLLSVAQGADLKLMLCIVISVAKLGGRFGPPGSVPSTPSATQLRSPGGSQPRMPPGPQSMFYNRR
jgi:hypothetical protein